MSKPIFLTTAGLEKGDYKAILHSKRANIFYLEKCRVMQKNGSIVYVTQSEKEYQYWSIPICNTTVLLLGTGTSITNGAIRILCAAGVPVGFCGGGGTPLFAGTDIAFMTPENEYRPTEYMQGWMSFWFDESKRLACAKHFQVKRCEFLRSTWQKDRDLLAYGFDSENADITSALDVFEYQIGKANSTTELLLSEAKFTKALYKFAANKTGHLNFVRNRDADDMADVFLNHGNYLAHGLAATTLWVLGIPHGFAIMHGKTRRGALVFDIADLIKDSIVLPYSFLSEKEKLSEKEFRMVCLQKFTEHKVLDYMFNEVKTCSRLFSTGEVQ